MSSVGSTPALHNDNSVDRPAQMADALREPFPLRPVLAGLDVELESELKRYRLWREGRAGSLTSQQDLAGDLGALSAYPSASAAPTFASGEQGALAVRSRGSEPVDLAQASQPEVAGELARAGVVPALEVGTVPDPAGHELDAGEELRSSDDLLRSLEEEEEAAAEIHTSLALSEVGFLHSLLTPIGVTSLLFLMLSSAFIGYLLMKPGFLDSLGSQASGNGSEPALEANSGSNSDAAPESGGGLDALSQLPLREPSPSPTPSATYSPVEPAAALPPGSVPTMPTVQPLLSPPPLPTAPPGPISGVPNRSLTVPPPMVSRPQQSQARPPQPLVSPAQPSAPPARPEAMATEPLSPGLVSPLPPVANNPSPANPEPRLETQPAVPTPTAAEPVAASLPAASRGVGSAARPRIHYVVMPGTNESSLSRARQVVRDAYVRQLNGQSYIQLGAFSDPENARKRADQLQSAGLSVSVIEP